MARCAALAAALLVPAGVTAAGTQSATQPIAWGQFQGGPGHAGAAPDGPAPAYADAWKFAAPEGRKGLSGAVVVGDTAIVVGGDGVYGVDVENGSERWRLYRNGGLLSLPAVGDVQGDRILAFTDRAPDGTTNLAAVDISGEARVELWRQPLKASSRSGVTIDGDNVFVADDQGRVYGFDLRKGDPLWEPVRGVGRIDAPPAAGEGRVYAVSRDTANGAVEVFGVDVATGRKIWTFQPRAQALSVSALAVVNGEVCVVGPDQLVYELGAEKGNTLATFRVGTGVSPLSAPAVSGRTLFVADLGGGVHAYDLGSGERLWDYQFNELQLRSSPVVVSNSVVVGLNDGRLVAIDVKSGHLVWQSDTGTAPVGPIAVVADRLVAATAGAHGGLIGLAHDASASLTDIPSPSELNLSGTLAHFALAFLGGSIVILGATKLLALRFPFEPVGVGEDEPETQTRDEEGDE